MPGDDILREELARLLSADGEPDATDALDALWIARLSGLDPLDPLLADVGPGTDPTAVAQPPVDSSSPAPPTPDSGTETGADGGSAPFSVRLHLPEGSGTAAPAAPGGAHTVRVGQPPALTDVLSLTRALRPLRQSIPSTGAHILDVQATAAASGDTGLLLPVLRPASERRFSVDLLVDVGTTMTVWHRLAVELRTVLERHGAFAGVRCWALHTDEPEPRLASFRRGAQVRRTTRSWREPLADPTGRRVVLVLTDGVGPAWYGDELAGTLAAWSRDRPVAALQVLPSRLWHRTALRTAPVRARSTETLSATIEVRASGPLAGVARGRAGAEDRARIDWLPVLEVAHSWLDPWARLVSGRTTDWTPLRAAPLTVVDRPRMVTAADAPGAPAEWIERFEAGYSPEAFALVRLLAAAPLSLPVMRLVQRALLPASTPMHLAEIFLSGLLVRRTPMDPGEDPDAVLYDFREGVREALLARLTRRESMRVLRQVLDGVSERVAETVGGGVTDFRALVALAGAEGGLDGVELPEGSRAFAEVALAVIKGAGGDYGDVVTRLIGGAVTEAGPKEKAEERRRRERGGGLFRRWGRRSQDADDSTADASTSGGVKADPPVRERVPSRVPMPPESYVRRGVTSHVLDVLLRGAPGGTERYPVRGIVTCVIEGVRGVGKTALAIDCALELAAEFTMVRWIRAHSRETLLDDLTALATDLGLSGVTELRSHLRDNPGWLLIYDGVREGDDWPEQFLPPAGYGSVLVTLAEWESWSDGPSETVTLDDFSPATALEFLQSALAGRSLDSAEQSSELSELIELVGRHPRDLAANVSAIKDDRRSVSAHIEDLRLMRRGGTALFLRSLVWITQGDAFLGTGVVVRPDAVLALGGFDTFDLEAGAVRVHQRYGAVVRVKSRAQHVGTPDLTLLRLSESVLTGAPLAHTEHYTVFSAAWYAQPVDGDEAPRLRLRSDCSDVRLLPRGAALVDADGNLRSLVGTSGDGTATEIDVTAELLSSLTEVTEPPPARAHVWATEGPRVYPQPEPTPSAPCFYLSFASGSFPDAEGQSQVRRFYDDLASALSELRSMPEPGFAFFGERSPLATDPGEQVKSALARAQVFVPLYSPAYFDSAWCGREWNAFSRRARRGRRGSVILPVLWTGSEGLDVPPVASDIQYTDSRLGSWYLREGLVGLLESDVRTEYRLVVRRIAQMVANAASNTHLEPCDIRLFDHLRNAFERDVSA